MADRQVLMTKQAGGKSPTDGASDTEQVERSGPMWESTVRLVGDDETAHRAYGGRRA